MKRLFALLLCMLLLLSLFPVSALAAKAEPTGLWEQITAIEDRATAVRGATTLETRAAAYSGIVDQVIAIVERSEGFVPGSLIRHGDFFYWDEADGTACGYSPRLRAQIREGADPNADPEAFSGTDTVCYGEKGGYPHSTTVSAFQPYVGIDSSFSAQYENRCNAIAQALGGTGTTYKTTNATIDNIAAALETSAVVIFDSHGDTDYANGYDYTSRANTSYICLQSGTGITSADQATVQGPYGSYKHAYYGGSYGQMQYYMVDGTAITNHMSGTSPNGLLWMAICLGMATDGLQAPIRARGVEVAYGYSQSVTFAGDYAWEAKFWQKMIAGENVKDSIAYMKQQIGCPDPYTGSYPAYPIVVSSEDPYPGHGNVDANQTVYSTYTLYTQFEITAVANNPEWGSVSLRGQNVVATPKYGYYVDGYEILEGRANVTQNGNVFAVDPLSDCTIQINFAPRDPAVIHFSVPEGVSCADLDVYVGDEITLPAPEGEPAVEGRSFRFLGWVTAPMAADSLDAPEFLAAGTEVKVTETEKCYYALYTYFVPVDGLEDDQFLRVDEAPHSWANEYVLSVDGVKALSADPASFGSNINNKLGTKKAVVDLASLGCSYEGDILNHVKDEITYAIEPAEGGTWTIKMKNANQYLAMAANSDTLTCYTSSNSNKTRWTISYGDNGPVIANAMYPGRSLQFDGTVFSCFSSAQQPLTLFAKAQGSNWYTTNPREKIVCDEHVFGDWSLETEPSCTETGVEARYCSVCGFKETRTVEALGHAWDEGVVTVEPTETEPGVLTYTCTRCGETRTEELPVLPHDCPCAAFEDMPEYGTPEHEAIDWAFTQGYTAGIDETHFGTGKSLSRAETATFLWTVSGKPEINEADFENPFTDVKPGKWYTKYVLWAKSQGLVDGYEDGTFRPNSELNRGEILTLLYAWAGKPSVEGVENPYSDVAPGKWYEAPAIWAYSEGIEQGENGLFARNTLVTRETFVLYLYRYMTHNQLLGD